MNNRVDAFLDLLVKQNGSDLHLISGNAPRLRLFGDIHPVKYRNLTETETLDLIYEIIPEHARLHFTEHGSADFSYAMQDVCRFRVTVFRHVDGIGAVFRAVPTEVKSLNDLQLPPVLKNIARQKKGLILVTGPTGSGKSTTLAALVDFINREIKGHIITIEDPIEHVHTNKKCLISQREVGIHTSNFASALHAALREDPDVVLVGEMRDLETVSMAITAAEMGMLVMATLHTNGAAAAINRIINVFPPGEEPYVRTMLSTSLCGIVSQNLVKTIDNKGRLAATEILVNNAACANIIREGKTEQLENVLQSGSLQGMQTIDHALRRLVDSKSIAGAEAYKYARNKKLFEQYIDESSSSSNKIPSENNITV